MKLRTLKQRYFAHRVLTAVAAPVAKVITYIVTRKKDGEVVASGVALDTAISLVEKAKASKKAALQYAAA